MHPADFLEGIDEVAVDEIGQRAEAVEGDCFDGACPGRNVIGEGG
jgi:hypothetical protein